MLAISTNSFGTETRQHVPTFPPFDLTLQARVCFVTTQILVRPQCNCIVGPKATQKGLIVLSVKYSMYIRQHPIPGQRFSPRAMLDVNYPPAALGFCHTVHSLPNGIASRGAAPGFRLN
jgi:hypothetical protein